MFEIDRVGKRYDNGYLALTDCSLTITAGEIVAIIGGSGCGKSTLLRLLSGLDRPTAGQVRLDGEIVHRPRADIGLVFQEPRLLPWLTIADNVGFGLAQSPRAEREARVAEALARVDLTRLATAWPRQLSGGQAQRVALARGLVGRPKVLLLDEPFSALDALTRYDLQDHLLELWTYYRPTTVLVTHDIEEALVLADRVVVMRGHPGRLHRVLDITLPRPRDRADPRLDGWKHELFADLLDIRARAIAERDAAVDYSI